MARYLVTGGAGFIGSHLVEALLAAGHAVTVIDNLRSGRRENLPAHDALTFREMDLFDLADDRIEPFDGLVHLAALPSVDDSWKHALEAHQQNLTSTLQMLELARAWRIPRVIYMSSAAVYGEPQATPIKESNSTQPLSPYGLQKLTSEHYGRLMAEQHGLTFVALRAFNVYGPRQVPTSPYSGVISKFADALRADGPVRIFGDGGQTRDFVHVSDIARGLTLALEASGLPPFTVCNLGTGRAMTIRELFEMMRAHFPGWKGEVETAPAPPGDIRHSLADIATAQKLLGYEPRCALETGLAELLRAEA